MENTALVKSENTTVDTVLAEEKRFELAQRQAQIYAKSTLVPTQYQNNVGNVLIATNMAHRMGADVLMVMQNLYVVHGRPSWSASFLIGTFNTNGRFSTIKYRFKGQQGQEDWGCQAYCTELATGDVIEGPWVTWKMATAEGWTTKNGSKWKTIPELMFRYRAATFLIRTAAPEIGLGLHTAEESEDMGPSVSNGNGNQLAGVSGLKERLKERKEADVTVEALPPDEPVDVSHLSEEPEPTSEPAADLVDPAIHEAPADTDEPAVETSEELDPLESLRANVKTAFDELPKNRQKDLIAGRPSIAQMSEEELKALLKAITD